MTVSYADCRSLFFSVKILCNQTHNWALIEHGKPFWLAHLTNSNNFLLQLLNTKNVIFLCNSVIFLFQSKCLLFVLGSSFVACSKKSFTCLSEYNTICLWLFNPSCVHMGQHDNSHLIAKDHQEHPSSWIWWQPLSKVLLLPALVSSVRNGAVVSSSHSSAAPSYWGEDSSHSFSALAGASPSMCPRVLPGVFSSMGWVRHPPALVWGPPQAAGGSLLLHRPPWHLPWQLQLPVHGLCRGFKGISVPAPGADPEPPSVLMSAGLFLFHSLTSHLSLQFLLHSNFSALNTQSQSLP